MRWFLLALVLLIGVVQSQQTAKAEEPAQRAAKDTRGTKKNPLSVEVVVIHKTPEDTKQEQIDREKKDAPEKRLGDLTEDLAKSTRALVIIGCIQFAIFVLQLIVFWWQGIQLKRTVDTTIVDLQPVLSPKIINMDRLHPILRPGTTVTFTHPETHKSVIYFIFENFGKTPGMIRRVQADLFLTEKDRLPTVDWKNLPTHHHQETMPGGIRAKDWDGPAVDFQKDIVFSSKEFNELVAESSATSPFRRFFLAGIVIYDDFFGVRHTRRFCLKLRVTDTNRFQAQHGGAAYNNMERKKIPKKDPLEKVEA